MIGTSYEMMLYMSYLHDVRTRLGLSAARMVRIRERISSKKISEDKLIEMLSQLDCVQIRPAMVLPAIVRDKNGRLFDERTFVKLFFAQETADRYGFDRAKVISAVERGKFADRVLMKHIVRSKQAHIIVPRETIPSVWSYEPIPIYMDDEKIISVRRMLGYNIED